MSSQSYGFSHSHVWLWVLDHLRINAFELWCWRRLLRVPWTARRSNHYILKEISPEYSLEGQMLKLKLQYLTTWCEQLTHWKRTWCWERLKAGGEWDNREWGGWITSLTRWTWVWASSRSWWRTGKPGMLHSMGSQKLDTTELLNRTDIPRTGLAGICGSSVFSFRGIEMLFSMVAQSVYNPTNSAQAVHFLHILVNQYLLSLVFMAIIIFTGLRWYLTLAFIFIALIISKVKHIFVYLLAFWTKVYLLLPFLNQIFYNELIEGVIYKFWILIPDPINCLYKFSPVLQVVFSFRYCFFHFAENFISCSPI